MQPDLATAKIQHMLPEIHFFAPNIAPRFFRTAKNALKSLYLRAFQRIFHTRKKNEIGIYHFISTRFSKRTKHALFSIHFQQNHRTTKATDSEIPSAAFAIFKDINSSSIFRSYFSKSSKNLFISDTPFDLTSSNEKGMELFRAIKMPFSPPNRS